MFQATQGLKEEDWLSRKFQGHTGQHMEMPISKKNRTEQEKMEKQKQKDYYTRKG